MKRNNLKNKTWLILGLAAAVMFPRPDATAGQAPVPLGSATTFAVLAGSTVTSAGATTVDGDIGVSPGTALTGAPTVSGTIHLGDPAAAQAQLDLTTAYNDAAGRTLDAISLAGNLGGQTLTPGLYNSTSSLEISSGDLTLDAQGDANAVFVFQMASTLTTTSARQVILSGGAKAANIFWQVGSSATLGTGSVLKGNILALASITVTTGATVDGRLLARTAAVTLDANSITIPAAPAIPARPSFGPVHRANGSATLLITNTPGLQLTLQSSPDLSTWTTLTTLTPLVSPTTFTNTTTAVTRFYRAFYGGTSAAQ